MKDAVKLLTPTVQQIAQDLGVSAEALRTWRRGTRTPPNDAPERLAACLNAQADALRSLARRLP